MACWLPMAALSAPVAAQPAAAQPATDGRTQAEAFKAEADRAYLDGDYALALQRLEKAYALDPDPRYVANQALVHEQLGQYAEAVAKLRQFLESKPAPAADKAAAARKVIARLEPTVRIETDPPGATVRVDDAPEPIGTTPLETTLVAGTHTLQLELAGHAPLRQVAKVLPADGLVYRGSLAPLPAPPPAPPPVVVREARGFGLDGWGWVAVGGAAAAGIGWAVLHGLGTEAAETRDAATTGADWDAAHERVELYHATGVAAAGLAGAALVTGVVLLLVAEDAPVSVGPAAVDGAGGALLFGRF